MDFSGCCGSASGCCCFVACLFVFCCCWRFLGSLPWAYGLRLNDLEGRRNKVGEPVLQTLLLTETVIHVLGRAQLLFHALFGVKTLSGTLFPPPLMKPGYVAILAKKKGLRGEVPGRPCLGQEQHLPRPLRGEGLRARLPPRVRHGGRVAESVVALRATF